MATVSKSIAYHKSGTKKGKLKKGFYHDKDGKLRKSQPVKRTKLYSAAKALGSAGGKANAKKNHGKQRSLF